MAKNLLLTTLYEKRIEIKFGIITLVVAGSLLLLGSYNVLDGLEHHVNTMMGHLVGYGALGTFLIALLSNWTLVIQVPYNLPMFTVILYADTVWEVILIGAAAGLGGGIGEILSYSVARAIVANVDELEDSALFRWTKKHIQLHPRLIPYLVCLASGVPVPDVVMIVPVAMVKYPRRKVILPMLAGKLFQNIVVALSFYYAAGQASGLVSGGMNIDVAAIVILLFVIIIAYQIDKSRVAKKEAAFAAHGNPSAHNAMFDLGGPEALSPLEVVPVFEKATNKPLEI
jgi:hypothetical protein